MARVSEIERRVGELKDPYSANLQHLQDLLNERHIRLATRRNILTTPIVGLLFTAAVTEFAGALAGNKFVELFGAGVATGGMALSLVGGGGYHLLRVMPLNAQIRREYNTFAKNSPQPISTS